MTVERTNVTKAVTQHALSNFKDPSEHTRSLRKLKSRVLEVATLVQLSSNFHPSPDLGKTRTEEHGLWTVIMDVIMMVSQQSIKKELTKKEFVNIDGND